MGRIAEAFCEHLMHGAAAARMSACMAKPAVTSCQAALSARTSYDTNCTETFEKLIELHCVWASDTEGGVGGCTCMHMWASDTEGGSRPLHVAPVNYEAVTS